MSDSKTKQPPADWLERWHRIETCTKPADRTKAESAMMELYRVLGRPEPAFQWFDSPFPVILNTRSSWFKGIGREFEMPEKVQRRFVPASYDCPGPVQQVTVRYAPMAFIFKEPTNLHSVMRQWQSPPINFPDRITPLLQRAIHDWICLKTLESYVLWPFWVFGQHDAHWIAACQWWRDEAGEQLSAQESRVLEARIALAESCGWGYPCEDQCLLCERPVRLELDPRRQLHSEQGPAVRFRDGGAVWALNGVVVPEWLSATPKDQLEPRRVLEIYNVQVRREFVRKVGMERICSAFNAVSLDRQGNYELLLLELRDGWQRPYLKMLNPSVGTWHIEGVDPSCRTVAESLAWRNQTNEPPHMLT